MEQADLTLFMLAELLVKYAEGLTKEVGEAGNSAFRAYDTALECFDENLRRYEVQG